MRRKENLIFCFPKTINFIFHFAIPRSTRPRSPPPPHTIQKLSKRGKRPCLLVWMLMVLDSKRRKIFFINEVVRDSECEHFQLVAFIFQHSRRKLVTISLKVKLNRKTNLYSLKMRLIRGLSGLAAFPPPPAFYGLKIFCLNVCSKRAAPRVSFFKGW